MPHPRGSYLPELHLITRPRLLAPPFLWDLQPQPGAQHHCIPIQVSLVDPPLQSHTVTIPSSSERWAHSQLAFLQQTTSAFQKPQQLSEENCASSPCTRKHIASFSHFPPTSQAPFLPCAVDSLSSISSTAFFYQPSPYLSMSSLLISLVHLFSLHL